MVLSFEWLIDPIEPTTFFTEFYERKPLLIERGQSSKFESLLSIDVIDRYLSTATPCRPDVFLVDAARELKPEDYSFPNSEPPGRIDLPRAYQLFATGATISLSQLHDRLPRGREDFQQPFSNEHLFFTAACTGIQDALRQP
jgi:hypothetical protein